MRQAEAITDSPTGALGCPSALRPESSTGTLHQVILRESEQGTIVADAEDRAAFLGRLGDIATATGTTRYAWALLPTHAHRLLRSGPAGLPLSPRRPSPG